MNERQNAELQRIRAKLEAQGYAIKAVSTSTDAGYTFATVIFRPAGSHNILMERCRIYRIGPRAGLKITEIY